MIHFNDGKSITCYKKQKVKIHEGPEEGEDNDTFKCLVCTIAVSFSRIELLLICFLVRFNGSGYILVMDPNNEN